MLFPLPLCSVVHPEACRISDLRLILTKSTRNTGAHATVSLPLFFSFGKCFFPFFSFPIVFHHKRNRGGSQEEAERPKRTFPRGAWARGDLFFSSSFCLLFSPLSVNWARRGAPHFHIPLNGGRRRAHPCGSYSIYPLLSLGGGGDRPDTVFSPPPPSIAACCLALHVALLGLSPGRVRKPPLGLTSCVGLGRARISVGAILALFFRAGGRADGSKHG